jgi:hypothetical protein
MVQRGLGLFAADEGLFKKCGLPTSVHDLQWIGVPKCSLGQLAFEDNDGFAPDTYNWSQLLVRVLQQCGDDLSRDNVMRQATNIRNFIPTMLLPGLSINTGPKDYAPIKQVQLTKFEGERWMPLGDPV